MKPADSPQFEKQEEVKQELYQSWPGGESPIRGEISDAVNAELRAVRELPVTVSYQVNLVAFFTQAFTELAYQHLRTLKCGEGESCNYRDFEFCFQVRVLRTIDLLFNLNSIIVKLNTKDAGWW